MGIIRRGLDFLAESKKDFSWQRLREAEVAVPGLGLIAGLALTLNLIVTTVPAQAVLVNGQQIAIVKDTKVAKGALEEMLQEQSAKTSFQVEFIGNITYKPVKVSKYTLTSEDKAAQLLAETKQFTTKAIGIKVNGETAVVLKSTDEAQRVLDELKKYYVSKLPNAEVKSAEFEEQVNLESVNYKAADLLSVEQAVELLTKGRGKNVVHVVKNGESLWTIARANDLHVKDIMEMNPQIKSEADISIGQEIHLSKTEPVVQMKIVAEVAKRETIPYKVKVVSDKQMDKGQKKVVKAGKDGERDVVYQVTMVNGQEVEKKELQSNILSAPVEQVVHQGARRYAMVASRGGSGVFGWPIRGTITSPFGSRWGSYHEGIDIDGVTGEPIGAAGSGKVIYAGWLSGYGKCVKIDHGNGTVTLYGHMSAITVKVGEQVDRGEMIGKVGNTGRSTGSHLHFEVIVHGSHRNPVQYLK